MAVRSALADPGRPFAATSGTSPPHKGRTSHLTDTEYGPTAIRPERRPVTVKCPYRPPWAARRCISFPSTGGRKDSQRCEEPMRAVLGLSFQFPHLLSPLGWEERFEQEARRQQKQRIKSPSAEGGEKRANVKHPGGRLHGHTVTFDDVVGTAAWPRDERKQRLAPEHTGGPRESGVRPRLRRERGRSLLPFGDAGRIRERRGFVSRTTHEEVRFSHTADTRFRYCGERDGLPSRNGDSGMYRCNRTENQRRKEQLYRRCTKRTNTSVRRRHRCGSSH